MYASTSLRRRVVPLNCCNSWDGAANIGSDLIPKTRPSSHCNSKSYNIPVETRIFRGDVITDVVSRSEQNLSISIALIL